MFQVKVFSYLTPIIIYPHKLPSYQIRVKNPIAPSSLLKTMAILTQFHQLSQFSACPFFNSVNFQVRHWIRFELILGSFSFLPWYCVVSTVCWSSTAKGKRHLPASKKLIKWSNETYTNGLQNKAKKDTCQRAPRYTLVSYWKLMENLHREEWGYINKYYKGKMWDACLRDQARE